MTSLASADLAALLMVVPLPVQQRDEPVRLSLRPGIPADYCGPVELRDLRLTLSPWHWLQGELGHSPRSSYLRESLAAARAAAPELDTVEGTAAWVSAALANSDQEWHSVPGEVDEWGIWGPTVEAEAGTGSFLPPGVALPAVLFLTDDTSDGDERIVVAQVRWQGATGLPETGPVEVFASSGRIAAEGSAEPAWLMGWGALLLADPATGKQAELSPRWLEDEDEADANEDNNVDAAEQEPASGEWAGQEPRYDAGTFYKTDLGQEPDWLRGKLHYAAGRLLRADTGQALILTPYLLPEPRP